jgi:hypothetical protein
MPMADIHPDEGLRWLLSSITRGFPAVLWLGLFTSQTPVTVPTRTAVLAAQDGVAEVTGPLYRRQPIGAASWSIPGWTGDGWRITADDVEFNVGGDGWGRINGLILATDEQAGAAVFYANFDPPQAVPTGTDDVLVVSPHWTFR